MYSFFHNPVKSAGAAMRNEGSPRKVSKVIKQDVMETPGRSFIIHCLLGTYYKCSTLIKALLIFVFRFSFCLGFFPNCLWQGQTVAFKWIINTNTKWPSSSSKMEKNVLYILPFVHFTLPINTGSLETLWKVLKVIFAYRTSQSLYEFSGCCKH